MTDQEPEIQFTEGEREALGKLEESLNRVAEWPPDSPLRFVLMLAPRTRGKLGEELLAEIAGRAGLATEKAESVAYDLRVGGQRIEVKFSTEDPPRFQQVRDPREPTGTKYDHLACISGRPHGLVYWLIPAAAVGELMDAGDITIQHAMSDTKWFLPSRAGTDAFAPFRRDHDGLVAELRSACA